jgi:hypothetical protein
LAPVEPVSLIDTAVLNGKLSGNGRQVTAAVSDVGALNVTLLRTPPPIAVKVNVVLAGKLPTKLLQIFSWPTLTSVPLTVAVPVVVVVVGVVVVVVVVGVVVVSVVVVVGLVVVSVVVVVVVVVGLVVVVVVLDVVDSVTTQCGLPRCSPVPHTGPLDMLLIGHPPPLGLLALQPVCCGFLVGFWPFPDWLDWVRAVVLWAPTDVGTTNWMVSARTATSAIR